MGNKYKSLAKDTIIFGIGNFGTKILSFLCVSLYTSYLTTSDYGTADAITTTISLLMPILTLSISEATLRFSFDKDKDQSLIYSISFKIVFASTLFLIGLYLVALLFFSSLYEYFWYFIGIFFFTSLEAVLANIVKGQNKTKIFALKGIVYSILFIGLNIILLRFCGAGLKGYLMSFLLANAITCFFMLFFINFKKEYFAFFIDKKMFKDMIKYSIPFIPATIAWWINSSSDKYMLIWLIDSSSNGLYSVAQKIPTILAMVTSIFTQAWQLSAMKNYRDDDYSSFFTEIYRLIYSLLLVCTCLIFVFGRHLAFLLFKNEFFDAWKFVPMLCVASVFSTLCGFFASAFTSAKKTNVLFVSTCCGAVANIIVNYFLITRVGIMGAAIATAISFLMMLLIRVKTMKGLVSIKFNVFKDVLSSIIIFVVAIILPYVDINHYYLISTLCFVIVLLINFEGFYSTLKLIFNKIKQL